MTSAPIESASWHRVQNLRPGLVPGLRIIRQPARGQVWHLLLEPASGRQLRLNASAWDLVGRFDGRATLHELWTGALERLRDFAPTQDEALALLAQLFRAGMVQFDAAPNLSLLFARRAREGEQRLRERVNPFMLRAKLLDPAPLLRRTGQLAQRLFSAPAAIAWLVLVAVALVAAAAQAGELVAQARLLAAQPASWGVALLVYPFVKALHEGAHALAVHRFGGEVHEAGLSLLFLAPAPYVDAGAANAFPARERALVSAAGILAELAIAAVALLAWSALSAGVVRDVMLTVVLICSVSTLAFNANPLLRFDGYFVLCDVLQLPNLAARSQAWWGRRWREWLGEPVGPAPMLAVGEAKWLALHAPLSAAYRLLLVTGFVLWVGAHSWLGGLLAALVAVGWLVHALWRRAGTVGPRSKAIVGGAAALLAVLAFTWPLPHAIVVPGVVWPPAEAQLRAATGGFVQDLRVADGTQVVPGEAVAVLEEPSLVATRERLGAEQMGLRARQYQALLQDPASAVRLQAELERNDAELARADEQLGELELRANAGGRVAWARPQDLPGSFAARGTILGHLVTPGGVQVRIALPQEDYARVRNRVRSADVRIADDLATVHPARLLPAIGGGTQELPSAALGDRQGGPIPVDPLDAKGVRTRAPVFLLDVAVPDAEALRMGTRAWVKLYLPDDTLGQRVVDRLSQLFVRRFDATGQL